MNLSEPVINKKMIECKNCVWPWIHLSTIIGILKWRTSQDDQFFFSIYLSLPDSQKTVDGIKYISFWFISETKKMIWEKKVLFHHLLKEHLHQEIWEPIQLHKNNQYCFFRTVCRVIFIFFSSNVQNVSHNQLRRPLLPLESFKNVFGCFSN
jgi:hypothetical protein